MCYESSNRPATSRRRPDAPTATVRGSSSRPPVNVSGQTRALLTLLALTLCIITAIIAGCGGARAESTHQFHIVEALEFNGNYRATVWRANDGTCVILNTDGGALILPTSACH